MSFRLALKPTYEVEVKIEFAAEGGRTERHSFMARFHRLKQTELESLQERARAGEITDRELLHEVLVALPGVQDADGRQIGDAWEDLLPALDVHPMQPTLVRAWYASLRGAREKNS